MNTVLSSATRRAMAFLFLCVAPYPLGGCAGRPAPRTVPLPRTIPPVATDEFVYQMGTINSDVVDERRMIEQGFLLANSVLRSECFRGRLLSAHLTSTKQQSNQVILDHMRDASVVLNLAWFDGSWWQNHWLRTIGYDRPRDPTTVHMNRYFVNSSYMVADNLLHEAAHARGYEHVSAKEASSVPYSMNRIFEECMNEPERQDDPPGQLESPE